MVPKQKKAADTAIRGRPIRGRLKALTRLAGVAAGYGVEVVAVSKVDELDGAIAGDGIRMVHVRTDRSANVAVHDEIHAAVAAAVTA